MAGKDLKEGYPGGLLPPIMFLGGRADALPVMLASWDEIARLLAPNMVGRFLAMAPHEIPIHTLHPLILALEASDAL